MEIKEIHGLNARHRIMHYFKNATKKNEEYFLTTVKNEGIPFYNSDLENWYYIPRYGYVAVVSTDGNVKGLRVPTIFDKMIIAKINL